MGRPPKDDPATRPGVARRITEAKERAGLTQITLGAKIHKSRAQVGEYETGNTSPDLAVLQKIAEVCGTTLGWLVLGDSGPDQSDAKWGPLFVRHKDSPFFTLALVESARFLAEEGVQANYTYLIRFTAKILEAAQCLKGDSGTEQDIRAALEAERAEIRLKKDKFLESLL